LPTFLDSAEELLEASIYVRDVKLLQDRTVWGCDVDAVRLAADIDANT